MNREPSKPLSVLLSVLIALALVTGAVAVPILWRGFYYGQIDRLGLVQDTGFSRETIQGAFDGVMEYLVKDGEFSTGELPWSESGRAHFADCKGLFRLDFWVLGGSLLALAIVLLAARACRKRPYRFLRRGVCFWALAGIAGAVLILGVWAAVDFTSLFTAFHTLFFPGKTNWIFDYRTDPIILILPQRFWAHAAALVGGLVLAGGVLLTLGEELFHWARAPKTVYEQLKRLR